jgi:hypothetical protein
MSLFSSKSVTIPFEGIKPSVRIHLKFLFKKDFNDFSRSLMAIEINVNFPVEKAIIMKVKSSKFHFNAKPFFHLDKVVGFRYGN